jgi:hypothetical protein
MISCTKRTFVVTSDILTAVIIKSAIFWDEMPCSMLDKNCSTSYVFVVFAGGDCERALFSGVCLHII